MIGYRVICPDGLVRHADLFDTQDDAFRWADMGHFCVPSTLHEIRPVDTGASIDEHNETVPS